MIIGITIAFRLIASLMFIPAFGEGEGSQKISKELRTLIIRVLFLPSGYKISYTGCTKNG